MCQDGVCARTAGRATAAGVPSPRRPAGQLTARCAAGGADVCVADVCVTTLGATETSVRDVLPARAPANQTGTVSFCVPPQSMMGALTEQLVAESLSLSVSQEVCGLPPVSRSHAKRRRTLQQHLRPIGGLHGGCTRYGRFGQ